MKGILIRSGALAIFAFILAAPVLGASVDVSDADRSWHNFTRDAATVAKDEVRLELRGMYAEDGSPELDLIGFPVEDVKDNKGNDVNNLKGGTIDLLGSIGLGGSAEAGINLPFLVQDTGYQGGGGRTDADIGDLLFYGKFKRMVATHCAVSLGLEFTVPTGIERKGFGTGEVGFNPFLSTRYQQGRFGVGGHLGYRILTGSLPDVLNYSAEAFARGSDRFLLRIEFSGRFFRESNQNWEDNSIFPGVDINLTDQLTLRPTAMANVTNDALEWGAGVGLAYTFSPFRQ
jgi:hypothetical protein